MKSDGRGLRGFGYINTRKAPQLWREWTRWRGRDEELGLCEVES